LDYDGIVFSPEPRDQRWHGDYLGQVEWEKRNLDRADVIAFWVPRQLDAMPAFTTNVEFGKYSYSGRAIYGRPVDTPKTNYLDWMYLDANGGFPCSSMDDLARAVSDRLYEGAERTGGECSVPLDIWKTEMFQQWYSGQKAVGNRLDDARVLWAFRIPGKNILFSYVLAVKVWVAAEQRHKSNEYIFSRKDISCIVPIWLWPHDPWPHSLLEGKVVLVKEFRSPTRTADCYVHELPGGSSFKGGEDVLSVASHELEEETGLKIDPTRFESLGCRQIASTLSTHMANLFYVFITTEELKQMEELERSQEVHGVIEDTERTTVEVRKVIDLLNKSDDVDWSMMGMLFKSLFGRKPITEA
jgi:8-oxo-dGTP pyrophosphatase MutT (NUDIX family)